MHGAANDFQETRLLVGGGKDERDIAVLGRPGAGPAIVWLGGFRSDVRGAKAKALDGWAAGEGRACLRFDYSGHGTSGGRFEDGTISRWLEEADAVVARFAEGPPLLVGSSMGGWIALLLARQLRGRGAAPAGMVLIAPAIDMTRALMEPEFDDAAWRTLRSDGLLRTPSAYDAAGDVITLALIEDGARHLFGDEPIETGCPVHVIQGMLDEQVPWTYATALMERLAFDDAVLTLIRDGDHRLSRPEDIERMIRAVADLAS